MSKIDTEVSNEVVEKFGWENGLNKYKAPIIIALFGLILIGSGILIFQTSKQETKIEIISSDQSRPEKQTIFVDIEGAVEKPGVYELDKEARVEELLVASGGLSASADRDWMAKSLNRAQKLTDGAKIFIPEKGEVVLGKTSSASQVVTDTNVSTTVNLNTASTSELEALWGIGPVTAQKIIEGRPYQNTEELLNRKIVKSNVYERIKNQVTVF